MSLACFPVPLPLPPDKAPNRAFISKPDGEVFVCEGNKL